jgi:hypothetical protein
MRTTRRVLVCSMIVMLCVIGSGASVASAAPAQLYRGVSFPSNASNHPGRDGDRVCVLTNGSPNRRIVLEAGDYLWESYERMVNRTPSDDYYTIHRAQDTFFLSGEYRWSSCLTYTVQLGCTAPGGGCVWWVNQSRLTDVDTGRTLYMTSYPPEHGPYEEITGIGSNLWQCSAEPVC